MTTTTTVTVMVEGRAGSRRPQLIEQGEEGSLGSERAER